MAITKIQSGAFPADVITTAAIDDALEARIATLEG